MTQRVVFGALLACSAIAAAQPRDKLLIATGWDNPTPQQLRRDLAVMDERPFDGVVVAIAAFGVDEGIGSLPLQSCFEDKAWKREWFARSVEDLKAVRAAGPSRLRHNFVAVNANPGNVDWFDDAGWANIVDHMRTAAWIARQGGMEGILFDAEPYAPPHQQFGYAAQPERAGHAFREYYAKARQRGGEAMRAMAEEYPDLTIFTYFMNSYVIASDPWAGPAVTGLADPMQALAANPYGLYSAFIDGWLDAAPPEVTFVDGNERAYRYTESAEFWTAVAEIKGDGQDAISPRNRAKYRAQVLAGHGIYLDAHRDSSSPWRLDPKGLSYAELLRRNVTAALRSADRYVWIYGEQGRWWPNPDASPGASPQYAPWPEVLPGCVEALEAARDPSGAERRAALRELDAARAAGDVPDLAANGDLSQPPAGDGGAAVGAADWTATGMPPGWSCWQEDGSKGVFGFDARTGCDTPGSGRAANVRNGCFINTCAVAPGERYVITLRVRLAGEGLPVLHIRYQDADGRWADEGSGQATQKKVYLTEPQADDEWGTLVAAVTVPEGAGRLVVLAGISGQVTDRDTVWFDDLHVWKVGAR